MVTAKKSLPKIQWKELLVPSIDARGIISYAPLLRVEPEPEPTPEPTPSNNEPVKDPEAVLNTNKELRATNKKLNDRIKGLEAKMEIFSQIDPEKYKALEQSANEAAELRIQLSKEKAELEAVYKEKLEKEKQLYVDTIDQEKATNLATIKEMMLQQEFIKHGQSKLATLFRSGHGHRFKLEFEGDRPTLDNTKLIAIDEKGEPRFVKAEGSNEMVPMGMKAFLESHKEDPDISVFIPAPTVNGTGTHSLGSNYRPSNGAAPRNSAEAFANLPTVG